MRKPESAKYLTVEQLKLLLAATAKLPVHG